MENVFQFKITDLKSVTHFEHTEVYQIQFKFNEVKLKYQADGTLMVSTWLSKALPKYLLCALSKN